MTTDNTPQFGDVFDEMSEGADVATQIVTTGLHAVVKARGETPNSSTLRAELTLPGDSLDTPLKSYGAIGFLSGVTVAILMAFADEVGKDPIALWQGFLLRYAAGKDGYIEHLKKENDE